MNNYLSALQEKFEQNRDVHNAGFMKNYMKGQYEYFGIKSPLRRELSKAFLNNSGLPDDDTIEEVVKEAWEQPEREYQYFAMDLLNKVAKKAEICRVDLYEYLIQNKSWWDTVDFIAINLVGEHFKRFPTIIVPYTEKWMDSQNIWLQRTAVLYQLKYKKDTDLTLLTSYIERLFGSREFFINKAIGWILREYSKTDADWVIGYVKYNETNLAGLSKREALKWLNNKRKLQITNF